MNDAFTLPHEAVDSITLANLIEMRKGIAEDIEKHENDGAYMHPEDYDLNKNKWLPALDTIIHYMGGYEFGHDH